MAWISRRQSATPLPGSHRPGLDRLQDEGRAEPARQHPPRRDHARGNRSRPQADDGRQPVLGRGRGHRPDEGAGAVRSLVDRGTDKSGRRAWPCPNRTGDRADRRRHRRSLPEPRDVQAAPAGRRHSLRAGRFMPHGRRERSACRDPDGQQVPEARVSARRRRRPVRVRAAPVDLRLHCGQRFSGASRVRIRRSSSRAFRRSLHHEECEVRDAASSGIQHRHQAAIDRRLRVPGRAGLEAPWLTSTRAGRQLAVCDGASARCSSSRPRSTTSTARCSAFLRQRYGTRSAGPTATTAGSARRSRSPTRSVFCLPAGSSIGSERASATRCI